jgi:hypothetical protein
MHRLWLIGNAHEDLDLSLLTIGASAEAGGRGGGSVPFTPPGFSSPGHHSGFEQIPSGPSTTVNGVTTTPTTALPGGRDEGKKAGWNSTLVPPTPPGLTGH